MLKGIAASSGICIGKAVVLKENTYNLEKREITNIENEIKRFHDALHIAVEEIQTIKEESEKKFGKENAEIFEAHIMILQDREFYGMVESKIKARLINAEYALNETVEELYALFDQMDNEYMKQRAADIKDIGMRVLKILMGVEREAFCEDDGQYILIAKDITPSDTARMDFEKVLGFATDIGGRTSHSAIMARSVEIPAVVGLSNASEVIKDGDMIILDGDSGLVFINPDDAAITAYREKIEEKTKERMRLSIFKTLDAVTCDRRRIEIGCNIGSPADVKAALQNGIDGIGLFRTEFLYMNKNQFPGEEEQFAAYKDVAQAMEEKPVTIRTLDIGGDKNLPYLPQAYEMNPFLGYRAIRMCLEEKDIFKTQLRAILRASVFGNVNIMFPMISGLEELQKAKRIVEDIKSELTDQHIPFNSNIKIGIMIEIPSAAMISDILAKECDFFSIGTNDLIQYTIAIDRTNEKVSHLYNFYNPAVLRLIHLVIRNAHQQGIHVGMCGEMAGDPKLAPILIGFGIDELSMSASSVLEMKKLIRDLSFEDTEKLSKEILSMGSCAEIEEKLKKFTGAC